MNPHSCFPALTGPGLLCFLSDEDISGMRGQFVWKLNVEILSHTDKELMRLSSPYVRHVLLNISGTT